MSNTNISDVLGLIEHNMGTGPHEVATHIAIQEAVTNQDYKALLLYLNLYIAGAEEAKRFNPALSFNNFLDTIKTARDQVALLLA